MATRDIRVRLSGDPSDLERAFKRATASGKTFEHQNTALGKSAHSARLQMMSLAGGLVGAGGVVIALKASIEAASNLHEQMNKVDVVFGSSAKSVKDWSKDTATNLGLASDKALEFAGVFGNMLKPMGFATDQAAAMSKELVNLSADMASFNNASPEDTLRALQSGLAGQVRPLRQFGVFLDQARIKQEALSLHLWNGKGALDAQAKAAASYAIILKDTKDAQGDFARTSGGLANQQRILKAQLSDLEAEIGTALMPWVLKITKEMNHWADVVLHSKRVHDDLDQTLKIISSTARQAQKDFDALSKALGGNKQAVEALGGAFAAWKLAGVLGGVSAAAGPKGAAGNVALLTSRLKMLGALGIVAVVIDIDMKLRKSGTLGKVLSDMAMPSQAVGDVAGWILGSNVKNPGGRAAGTSAPTGTPGRALGGNRNAQGAGVVEAAQSQLGMAYQWGGPAILGQHTDCSGLTQAALRSVGVNIGRTTYEQWRQGRPVAPGDLQPGDLVFFHMGPKGPEHVGVYIGDGNMIHDPHTGDHVRVQALSGMKGYCGARRYTKDAAANTPAPDVTPKVDLHGTTAAAKAKAKSISGSKLLSPGLQKALAATAGTKTKADDLRELRKAEQELLAQPQSLAVVKELASVRKQINAITTAETKKAHSEQETAAKKHAAIEIAQLKEMDVAWKKHVDVLKAAAAEAKRIADRSFQEAAQKMMSALDAQRAQLTPTEQKIKDLQDARAAKGRADAISQAQSDLDAAIAAGDPAAIAAAQAALDAAQFDQQLSDLQVQADKERKARDDEYASKSQALQDWLDDQKAKLDSGAENWGDFYDDLKKMAAQNGFDIGDAFWSAWNQAAADNGVATAAAANVAAQPTSLVGIAPPGSTVNGSSYGSGSYVVGGILVTPMASGGIVNGPTLAMVGESGPEAVIPLSGSGGGLTADIPLIINLDSERLFAGIQRVALKNKRRNGSSGLT